MLTGCHMRESFAPTSNWLRKEARGIARPVPGCLKPLFQSLAQCRLRSRSLEEMRAAPRVSPSRAPFLFAPITSKWSRPSERQLIWKWVISPTKVSHLASFESLSVWNSEMGYFELRFLKQKQNKKKHLLLSSIKAKTPLLKWNFTSAYSNKALCKISRKLPLIVFSTSSSQSSTLPVG